jgi:hypothetical protein
MPLDFIRYARQSTNNYCRTGQALVTVTSGREETAYPVTNLLDADRYVPWRCPAFSGEQNPTGDIVVTVDLKALKDVSLIGHLAWRLNTGSPGVPYYGSWEYQNKDTSVWTPLISGVMLRDALTAITLTRARYFRLTLAVPADMGSVGCSLGKLFVGKYNELDSAGPIIYAPGSVETDVMQRSRTRLLDGREVVTTLGSTRRRWRMSYPASPALRRETLRTLAASDPFYLMTPDRLAYEVRAVSDEFSTTAVWGAGGSTTSDLWDCEIEVESLP